MCGGRRVESVCGGRRLLGSEHVPTWTQELVEPACMLLLISLTVSHFPLSRTHWALVNSVQSCRLVRSPVRRQASWLVSSVQACVLNKLVCFPVVSH